MINITDGMVTLITWEILGIIILGLCGVCACMIKMFINKLYE